MQISVFNDPIGFSVNIATACAWLYSGFRNSIQDKTTSKARFVYAVLGGLFIAGNICYVIVTISDVSWSQVGYPTPILLWILASVVYGISVKIAIVKKSMRRASVLLRAFFVSKVKDSEVIFSYTHKKSSTDIVVNMVIDKGRFRTIFIRIGLWFSRLRYSTDIEPPNYGAEGKKASIYGFCAWFKRKLHRGTPSPDPISVGYALDGSAVLSPDGHFLSTSKGPRLQIWKIEKNHFSPKKYNSLRLDRDSEGIGLLAVKRAQRDKGVLVALSVPKGLKLFAIERSKMKRTDLRTDVPINGGAFYNKSLLVIQRNRLLEVKCDDSEKWYIEETKTLRAPGEHNWSIVPVVSIDVAIINQKALVAILTDLCSPQDGERTLWIKMDGGTWHQRKIADYACAHTVSIARIPGFSTSSSSVLIVIGTSRGREHFSFTFSEL